MASGSRDRAPSLTLVPSAHADVEGGDRESADGNEAVARELDWSILMARAQGGDVEAYRRLLTDIAPYLHSLARRHHRDPSDVEDTVQDVLLTVHAVRHTYDPHRPFGPWLVAIAKRRIFDRLRRQGRIRAREVTLDPEDVTFSTPEANYEEAGESKRILSNAIECLPPGQREAVRLLKLQEMSLQQAAAASGMSVAALKVAMHRAMNNLRKMLTKSGGAT
jgi:RNA polymerase sigma-70 factor (ECF subfamily)